MRAPFASPAGVVGLISANIALSNRRVEAVLLAAE